MFKTTSQPKTYATLFGIVICTILGGVKGYGENRDVNKVHPGNNSYPGTSIYHLESEWTDQDGRSFKLSNLAGDVVVIAMVFTKCEYTCSRIISDLRSIEQQLNDDNRKLFKLALFSFDSERDSPEVLKAFAEKRQLDPKRWSLLHGQPESVSELAAVLGVKYKKSEKIGFSHSNIMTVLNQQGEIAFQLKGLNQDLKHITKIVSDLL